MNLDKFFADVINKAENKAEAFVKEVVALSVIEIAVENNTLGDDEKHQELYQRRFVRTGGLYQPIAGLSSNNWQVTVGSSPDAPGGFVQEYYTSNGKGGASVESAARLDFKVGQTVYVTNVVDYIIKIGGKDFRDDALRNLGVFYNSAAKIADNINSVSE